MSTIAAKRTYTPEDLLTMPAGDLYELVNGELVERKMSALASLTAGNINRRMGNFLETNPLGLPFDSDCSYQCFADPGKVRRPDGSFIAKGRLPADQFEHGHIRIAPDLAIEVVSPNDIFYDVQEKVEEYLEAGVRLVWVIDPENRLITVHRADGSTTKLREQDELAGEDVLPGFRCRAGEIFPSPEQLNALTPTR
jgi:Uma2 family endonuclease